MRQSTDRSVGADIQFKSPFIILLFFIIINETRIEYIFSDVCR